MKVLQLGLLLLLLVVGLALAEEEYGVGSSSSSRAKREVTSQQMNMIIAAVQNGQVKYYLFQAETKPCLMLHHFRHSIPNCSRSTSATWTDSCPES